ncbi:MAG: hypothetical protein ABUK08_00010 [Candidatus Humimicrobiaceae bacterium]
MLSEVQFFVSQMDDPCKVDNRNWYITIFNCDGTLLEYAGQEYIVIHAPNGHASVTLPPGKYSAVAVWSYWKGADGEYYGNHFTHESIFQVCCTDHKCVWLYNPSVHECGIIYDRAVQDFRVNIDQTEQDLIAAGIPATDPRFGAIDEARNAIDTNLPALQALKAGIDDFANVFGFQIPDGTGINRIELLNETNAVKMDELTAASSVGIPQNIKITAELNANFHK